MPYDPKKEPRTLSPMPPLKKPARAVASTLPSPRYSKSTPPVPLRAVRFMQPEEQEVLKGWRKLDKEVDEFLYTWTLWKNWDTAPPIVVLWGGKPVGYHGVTFGKARGRSLAYVNSASQFVLPNFRGKRLAGTMINFLLGEAHKRNIPRLRFRTPLEGPGYECWRGFGVHPFGRTEDNLWYDLDITSVPDVRALLTHGHKLHEPPTTCATRLGLYRRNGVVPNPWGQDYCSLLDN